MTTKEYIDLAHSYLSLAQFYDNLSEYCNGEWTIDGQKWYLCVILEDDVGPGRVKIVTRNQTHTTEDVAKVRYQKPSFWN